VAPTIVSHGHPGRIVDGVNLGGVIFGPVLTNGMGTGEKSFLLWGNAGRNSLPGDTNIPSWTQWWNITDALDEQDWRVELGLGNSTLGTMTDFPLLADISGLRKPSRDQLIVR
jgi:hypothetical protein